jgi:hypothetical protein
MKTWDNRREREQSGMKEPTYRLTGGVSTQRSQGDRGTHAADRRALRGAAAGQPARCSVMQSLTSAPLSITDHRSRLLRHSTSKAHAGSARGRVRDPARDCLRDPVGAG